MTGSALLCCPGEKGGWLFLSVAAGNGEGQLAPLFQGESQEVRRSLPYPHCPCDRQIVGIAPPLTISGLAHPTSTNRVGLLCCPGKVQKLLSCMLQLIRSQMKLVWASGGYLSLDPTTTLQSREVVPGIPLSHLRDGSPPSLSKGSTLLCCPEEVEGPFS